MTQLLCLRLKQQQKSHARFAAKKVCIFSVFSIINSNKGGHIQSKCWIKNPEQKKAFIERKYGKRKNKGKNHNNDAPSNGDIDENTASAAPMQTTETAAGPSRTRAPEPPSKIQGTPPRTGSKNKQSRNAPKNKRTVARNLKPELPYFVPTEKSSYVKLATILVYL